MTEAFNDIVVGQSEVHVVPWRTSGRFVHRNMLAALEDLAVAAAKDGIQLEVASAYRSFERQLAIWNAKATGQRGLIDDQGAPLNFATLSGGQIVDAILRWSALPGTSRHHWGTDIDVYDSAAVPPDYKLQLTSEESAREFKKLHAWLDTNMARFGFFRPYAKDLGGIAPEPWHISYAPIARAYYEGYAFSHLEQTIRGCDLALKDLVLENLSQIFERYFRRISQP